MNAKPKFIRNTPEEEAAIQRGIAADSDTYEVPSADFAKMKRGRPAIASPKEQVSIRYDAAVLTAFRAMGAGWQTKMNDALVEWLAMQGKEKRSGLASGRVSSRAVAAIVRVEYAIAALRDEFNEVGDVKTNYRTPTARERRVRQGKAASLSLRPSAPKARGASRRGLHVSKG